MANLDVLFRLDQYVGPESLAELCFKVICKNLDIISVKDRYGYRNLLDGVVFPSEICDKLIEYVLRNSPNEDHDCFFTIFKNVWATKLKRVKVVGSKITDYSVQILSNHKLVQLELTVCPYLTACSIEYINANAENLQTLICHGINVIIPGTLTAYEKRGYLFATPHLRTLVLESVIISAPEYNILMSGLPNLTKLDLSNSSDVGSFDFFYLVPNLVSLVLYNVKITKQAEAFVSNICHLKNLRHLDISQINSQEGRFANPNNILADIVSGLPELTSLDISGTNLAGVEIVNRAIQTAEQSFYSDVYNNNLCDIPGLVSRVDKPLQFLGLYGSNDAPCRRRHIPAKLIAGNANEDQILIAAHVYMNNKEDLMQKVISDLYHMYRYENCHRMDQALCAVLDAMEKYPAQKDIQMSGSAALFYIVKMKEKGELETRLKKRIVRTLLVGMCIHRNEEAMMRNGCLTLYQFRLPHDVMSHYETLVKLLLHLAKHAQHHSYVQRIAVFLLNTLAGHVTDKEKRLLGDLDCITTMLQLIKYRVDLNRYDDVMEVAWSTMWNVTDETPINCERFLKKNGMQLFFRCVQEFLNKEDLLKNMLGLLGNVAEVQSLRRYLMPYVAVFSSLVHTIRETIEVPYNAVGILAHITSDGVEAWTVKKTSRNIVLQLMVQAIDRWDISSERNINYRSFLPLLRLVDVYHTPQCQHWAVWALANLTTVYPHKYCILVIREGGLAKLNALIPDPRPYERIKELARIVIKNCYHYSMKFNDTRFNAVDEDYVYNSDG